MLPEAAQRMLRELLPSRNYEKAVLSLVSQNFSHHPKPHQGLPKIHLMHTRAQIFPRLFGTCGIWSMHFYQVTRGEEGKGPLLLKVNNLPTQRRYLLQPQTLRPSLPILGHSGHFEVGPAPDVHFLLHL